MRSRQRRALTPVASGRRTEGAIAAEEAAMAVEEGFRLARPAASPMSQQMVVDRTQCTVADMLSSLYTGRDRRETRQCFWRRCRACGSVSHPHKASIPS